MTRAIPGAADRSDVRGRAWGSGDPTGFTEAAPYTPTTPGSTNATLVSGETNNLLPAVEDPPDAAQQSCVPGTSSADRSRDQNVYVAPLYPLALMESPGAIKIAQGVQRGLPVLVRNLSDQNLFFKLDIEGQPSDSGVSGVPPCEGLTTFQQLPLPRGDSSNGTCSVAP